MGQPWIFSSTLILTLFAYPSRSISQAPSASTEGAPSYRLSVAVDEVILNFHAADANGLSVNDLKLDELSLLDNGRPPRRVLAFRLLQNFPIRVGIVMDTSDSMQQHLPGNRAIAIRYAQQLFRQQTDQGFVMDFGRLSKVLQPWTSDAATLTAGIHEITAGGESRIHGTAIFDNIYRACLYQFGKIDHAASGNFILLFSDGEDNASSLSVKDAVDACQRANTAIYAFRTDSESSFGPPGPSTLLELASETGGRVFHDTGSEADLYSDLRTIEADLRNQYRLIYKPSDLKHNGSFHHIELRGPDRVDSINVRAGYYAPGH